MNAITLTHKIQIDSTCKQEKYFLQACGIARFTWNWALAEWKKQYEAGEKPNGLNLKKQFNAIKRVEFPWMYKVTKYASQQPFIFLQKSFERFFNRESDYPRFKKKGIHDSFYIGNDHIRVEGRRIHIPKLGWVRMCEELRFRGRIISATISRNANKWFVSLNVEIIELPAPCESQAGIGVDLGIIRLATLSNGKYFEGPKPLRRLKLRLKRLQRQLSRKEKGSKNRNKARMRVSKIHYRIACIRHDALHKLTTHLTDNFASIAIEDLNVKGMMSNNRFAGSIADMGFREFRRQLEYKAELRNNHVEIVSRWFPSSKRCSDCGAIKEDLKLADRTFECNSCGLEIDRDLNSAINLFSTVSSTGFKACGEEGSGSDVTSEQNQPL